MEVALRTFLPIITLLIAAVAGAQPAPTQAPQGTHRITDLASGETQSCRCEVNDAQTITCRGCAALDTTIPTIRVTGQGLWVPAPVWSRVTERVQDDARARALLADLEIQVEGSNFEFAFTCRGKPDDRKFVRPGLTMPQTRDVLVRLIHDATERACAKVAVQQVEETTWGGCPAKDAYDRRGFQRTANNKIRLTAQPDSDPTQWAKLRDTLVSDDLLYHCSDELLIDPVSSSYGDGTAARFRASIVLTCANQPNRRGEFDTGSAEMDAGTLRRFVGKELRRICGITATARHLVR